MQESERLLLDTVTALGVASEKHDAYTAGHQARVATLALAIARRLSLDKLQVADIRAASLHTAVAVQSPLVHPAARETELCQRQRAAIFIRR